MRNLQSHLLLIAACGLGASGCATEVFDFSSAIGDSGPLVYYDIEEAASGQAVTKLIDATGALDLDLEYSGASPVFGDDGDRYLQFESAGFNGGGASALAGGSVLDRLEGARTLTVESKHEWITCDDKDLRIVELSNGPASTNRKIRFGEESSEEYFSLSFAALEGTVSVRTPCATGPHVIHWVVDTERPIPADRIRRYVDGVRDATIVASPNVGLSWTLALGTTPRKITIGRAFDGGRGGSARIWSAGIYERALTEPEIRDRVSRIK